jgi:hypothetical protein
MNGSRFAAAIAFAVESPIRRAPNRPGPLVDVVQGVARVHQRLIDDRVHELEVMPGRDLRHDAAVALVEPRLGGDHVAADLGPVVDDGRAGVVARGLDREDQALADYA